MNLLVGRWKTQNTCNELLQVSALIEYYALKSKITYRNRCKATYMYMIYNYKVRLFLYHPNRQIWLKLYKLFCYIQQFVV